MDLEVDCCRGWTILWTVLVTGLEKILFSSFFKRIFNVLLMKLSRILVCALLRGNMCVYNITDFVTKID